MSLITQLTQLVSIAFKNNGFDPQCGQVVLSDRPDLGHFQCNGALAAARPAKKNPREIAQAVVDALALDLIFKQVSMAGPGFINLTLTDEFLVEHIRTLAADDRFGCTPIAPPQTIVLDYGGANVAKLLHVGHARPAIIGESIKRTARFLGYTVLGDVHLGDWGTQMGMLIVELQHRQPDLPYFDIDYSGPYPIASPVTIYDLEEIYPAVNVRAQADTSVRDATRQATVDLQRGRPGYRALWQHFVDVSVAELKRDYARLNVAYDLWLGESDTQTIVDTLATRLQDAGHAQESQGAMVIDVTQPDDDHEIPPLILVKSDGGVMYSTTDLATIAQRVTDYQPDLILYVVDNRQQLHFTQIFRAAHKTGVAPQSVGLEHLGHGTMNGEDGRPFKTRAGGVPKLRDLLDTITATAQQRMAEAGVAKGYPDAEKVEIAKMVGVAALRYADLMNHRATDYIFDVARFASFDGRTGPYLLYTVARAKSILRKANEQGLAVEPLTTPADDVERAVLLTLAEVPDVVHKAFDLRAPNHLCEYAYKLAAAFNRFYSDHHMLAESDQAQQASWLALTQVTVAVLVQVLDLLGIQTPERM